MSKGQLNIDLLGTSFAIQADETDEYLNKIYTHYTDTVEQVKRTSSVTDPVRLAVIAGILITDELYKEQLKSASISMRGENESNYDFSDGGFDSTEIEQSAKRMMEKIDDVLETQNENMG